MKNKMLLGMILCLALLFTATPVLVGQASTAVIWTDKADYTPGETVTVSGSGFVPYDYYDIPVIRPDGSVVLGDGSDTAGWDMVQADASGDFDYYYMLNGIAGLYEVRVYDSPWSGSLDQEALATTTFTDAQAAANLDQIRNGASDDPWDPGEWVNGNAGEQNSHYLEGWSIPYRVRMTDLPIGTPITLTLGYDIKHSDRNAIDYLTHYERLDPYHYDAFGHNPEEIDPLIGVSGVSGTTTTYTIPAPGSINSPVTGQPTQSYNDLVTSEGPGSVEMTLFGGTITDISYNVEGDLTAAQSETRIDVTFTVDSSTAVLAWGGHIASRLDWEYDEGGVPRSAGGISGSPYHMRLKDWYGETPEITKLLGNLGNQDRSLSAQAVYEPPVWPELDIDKICSPKVLVGGGITFTVVLTNTGTQDAEAVEVTDTLPAGVSYTTGTATATSGTLDDTTTPGTIVWTGTILKDGGTVTITIPVVATTTGDQLNYAEYTAYPENSVLINTYASCSTPVYDPGIDLTKTADPVKILSGASVTFTYVVENTGDLDLTVEIVDDQFGTIVSGESLLVGQTKTFTYTTTIADDITNVATATGTHQLGSVSDMDSASVDVKYPDISVTKTCSPETQLPLGIITWTIVVENTGDIDLTVTVVDSLHGTVFGPATIAVGGSETIEITDEDLPAGEYTNTVTATGVHQLGEVTDTDSATCTVEELYLKQFVNSGAFGGFTPPTISCNGLCSVVYELHSGPRIWWQVDYYFENSEEYLGDEFDGEGHYFILWDKWGGNLMALPSQPTAFDDKTNTVTLQNGDIFKIDYNEYKKYVDEGIELTDSAGGSAWITLHTGDQQEGTNPGNGKGSNGKDGKSYDTDVRWEIGWLEPGESRTLTLYIAPGKNPGGKLQFSSPGCYYINTGPRVRVYADAGYEDFLYAIDRTNRLRVIVLEPSD